VHGHPLVRLGCLVHRCTHERVAEADGRAGHRDERCVDGRWECLQRGGGVHSGGRRPHLPEPARRVHGGGEQQGAGRSGQLRQASAKARSSRSVSGVRWRPGTDSARCTVRGSSSSASGLPVAQRSTRRRPRPSRWGAVRLSSCSASADASPSRRSSSTSAPRRASAQPSRAPASRTTGALPSLRARNRSTWALAGSNQCTSSATASTGRSAATVASRSSAAVPMRSADGAGPSAAVKALRSAWRCGTGRPSARSSSGASSWCRAARGRCASPATPLAGPPACLTTPPRGRRRRAAPTGRRPPHRAGRGRPAVAGALQQAEERACSALRPTSSTTAVAPTAHHRLSPRHGSRRVVARRARGHRTSGACCASFAGTVSIHRRAALN
jgi:hypothetical protein